MQDTTKLVLENITDNV